MRTNNNYNQTKLSSIGHVPNNMYTCGNVCTVVTRKKEC